MTSTDFYEAVLARLDLALNVTAVTAALVLFVAGVVVVRAMWSR